MFRSIYQLTPATTVTEIQRSFSYSDEHLASRFGVPIDTVQSWRQGHVQPSKVAMKQMFELLQLHEALGNARSGKYRQA